ncbi:MAG TPA: DUF3891 family protein [Baekduia sp.]|nr:DUF3891 family protein [Baekduia sp.]
MIVRADGLCVGQASHAWMSGQLAEAWAWPVDRPQEAALAALQHDVGMAEHDVRSPLLDEATGGPVGFTALPRALHLELWTRAPALVESQSAYAALGVSLHGTGLYARAADDPAVAAYLEQQRGEQERLAAVAGASAGECGRLQALLRLWDAISLSLLLGWALAPVPVPGAAGADVVVELADAGDGTWTLDPWPLRATELEVRCEGRRLAEPASDARALRAALARAPRVDLRFLLRRPQP